MSRYAIIELIAAFLAHNYKVSWNETIDDDFLALLQTDYNTVRETAYSNRVWTNIVATISESPSLLTKLGADTRKVITIAYLTIKAQSMSDIKQLQEIDNCASLSGTRFILMKGANRIFDDLYPTSCHRQMSDIDMHIGQQKCIAGFLDLGYETMEKAQGEISEINDEYIEQFSQTNHHLPPIVSNRFNKRIELHLFFIHRFLNIEMRSNAIDLVKKIKNTNHFYAMSKLDQLILLIIHSRFADRSASFSSSRLRGILEGLLLFRTLSQTEQQELTEHFRAFGEERELRFWKYLCYRLFSADQFKSQDTLSMSARYQWHKATSHRGWALSFNYALGSIRLLLTHRLRSPLERKQFTQRLFSGSRWRRYLKRITRFR